MFAGVDVELSLVVPLVEEEVEELLVVEEVSVRRVGHSVPCRVGAPRRERSPAPGHGRVVTQWGPRTWDPTSRPTLTDPPGSWSVPRFCSGVDRDVYHPWGVVGNRRPGLQGRGLPGTPTRREGTLSESHPDTCPSILPTVRCFSSRLSGLGRGSTLSCPEGRGRRDRSGSGSAGFRTGGVLGDGYRPYAKGGWKEDK